MKKSVTKRLLFFIAILLFFLFGCANATRFIFSTGATSADPPPPVGLHYQAIWFKAPDNTKLHGWLVPGDPTAPMVLFFHGNAANITHRVPNIDFLNKLGLNVFIFDYRGYGKSNGTPLREEDLYKDARGALLFLKEKDWGGKRLIYYGRSMGATVALQMSKEQPPAGIILECPFTSLPEIATLMKPISYDLIGKWFIKDRFDNEKKIKEVSTPLLIFHGKKDQVIPYEMSIRLYSLGNQPKSLFLVENAGHSDCYILGGEEYRNSWKSFLKKTTNYNCSF